MPQCLKNQDYASVIAALSVLCKQLSARAQWSCPQQGSMLLQKLAKHFSASELRYNWGEKSPGAAAFRLIETPVAKSLIFQPYSLNISRWEAKLFYSVLNSWGMEARQHNNYQLWLRGLGINKETTLKKIKKNYKKGSFCHIFTLASRIAFSSLFVVCGETILTTRTFTDPSSLVHHTFEFAAMHQMDQE